MFELWISDLISEDEEFEVPCDEGTWKFERRDDYKELLERMVVGQCANTFYAYNETIGPGKGGNFEKATDELIDICLVLSFLSSKCVTPTSATPKSDVSFIQMGDKFIRPRSIYGFSPLQLNGSLSDLFSSGFPVIAKDFDERRIELFLSYWISGLTCFTLEDLFLSIGVQMDIVKQCEISIENTKLTYFEGMESASRRYGLPMLESDYKKMRNDIVHEGKLSGSNFKNKGKV